MITLRKPKLRVSFVLLFLVVVFGSQVAFGDLDLGTLIPLDGSVQIKSTRAAYDRATGQFSTTVTTTNTSTDGILAPVYLVIESVSPATVTVANADGLTTNGKPYFVLLQDGELAVGASTSVRVAFTNPQRIAFTFVGRVYGVPQIVRVIEFPRANPDVIFVNQPTTVTVTVQIGADPELLMNQVYLLRLNDAGFVQANLGPMYDDGTHGDVLIGDGTFTTQVQLNEPSEGQIRLKVEANYIAPPTPAYSDIITVNVVSPPQPETVNEILSQNAQTSQEFHYLASQVGVDQARQVVLGSLQADPLIAEAFIAGDGTTICITYECGLQGGILTGLEGNKLVPGNNTGIAASHPEFNNAVVISGTLNGSTCVNCSTLLGNAYTLNQVKDFDSRGVVYLDTHGTVYGPNPNTSPIAVLTGEEASSFLGIPTSHFWDWLLGRIVPLASRGVNYWAFKPSFIEAHCTSFPNSLVVASACHSYENLTNTTMANAFLDGGCATYVGWSDTVSVGFANGPGGMDNTLFTRLADGDSVQQAFAQWTLAQRTDPSTGAIYGYVGDGNLKLPIELMENGNFETGDLSGWTTGFTEGGDFPYYGSPGGYYTVISERKVEGMYSARLGRFDQTYTQGLYGPPQIGDEPSGQDWMYQDVEIPAGSHKTLKFSYKIRTYDTVIWDWFDAKISNPSTGITLATVVSHAGKPGYDYGEYWENDWQEVMYDLSPYAGQTIRIQFECRQDGWGDQTAVYVDKVSIPCN
jgi:hypothetical protein